MSHTRAPWTVAGHLIVGHRGSPVCELSPASLMAGSITEQEANARLIAAAPELLEALKCIRRDLDDISGASDRDESAIADCMTHADEVIFKAEGKS